jgi:hypothetical protein
MAIQTEGYSSPEKLYQVTFTVSGSNVIDPTALKLYAGQAASTSTLSELAGTVTETAGVYTYTLTDDYALSNGSNLFCLGGDVLPTATFNATAQVTITAVATVGGATAFTPAEAVTLTVEPMYLMATDATYTIDDEVSFYDEGGKDGHVIKGFDGKVVFSRYLALISSAAWVTVSYAVSNVIFTALFMEPFGRIFKRLCVKYGIGIYRLQTNRSKGLTEDDKTADKAVREGQQ